MVTLSLAQGDRQHEQAPAHATARMSRIRPTRADGEAEEATSSSPPSALGRKDPVLL